MNKDTSKISAQGGMFEVKLGKVTEQKAHSKEVKEFGKMMVADHSNVDDTLRELAHKNNIILADTLNNENQDKIGDMSKLSSRKFDKEYVSLMVEDHTGDVAKFREEAQNASSPEVRKWA